MATWCLSTIKHWYENAYAMFKGGRAKDIECGVGATGWSHRRRAVESHVPVLKHVSPPELPDVDAEAKAAPAFG